MHGFRGLRTVNHAFWQRLGASHGQVSLFMILVLFQIGRDASLWAPKMLF